MKERIEMLFRAKAVKYSFRNNLYILTGEPDFLEEVTEELKRVFGYVSVVLSEEISMLLVTYFPDDINKIFIAL